VLGRRQRACVAHKWRDDPRGPPSSNSRQAPRYLVPGGRKHRHHLNIAQITVSLVIVALLLGSTSSSDAIRKHEK
jgi:hypothetical protein